MKKYKEFRDECIILEHPNLKARIIAKINPMDKIRDKIDDLKKLPGKIKDTAIDNLQKQLDRVNPMSPINKKITMMRKDKLRNLRDKKGELKDKIKRIDTKIDSIKAKVNK